MISGVVLLIGVVVGLFLPMLVGDVEIPDSIYLIYALFLVDCLCSYFLAYKKSLLYADMMNYIPDTIYLSRIWCRMSCRSMCWWHSTILSCSSS